MFTGIIEEMGLIKRINPINNNLNIWIECAFASELKIDQSVAHNGVCLTVVEISYDTYRVTAIEETLQKTNLSNLKLSDKINLERALKLGERIDGHLVQGHVDQTAVCVDIVKHSGSSHFTFEYDPSLGNITIEKGSITVNGVSLTVLNSKLSSFTVAIIPYTLQHTNFSFIEQGCIVNLEFDLIGKYIKKLSGL